jgi:uncharacterized protein HemX
MATDEVPAPPTPSDDHGDPGTVVGRLRERRGLVAAGLVALILLGASGVVAIEAHDQQHRIDAQLSSARAQLRRTDTLLPQVRAQLAVDTAQSDQAGHTLSSDSSQLAADQAQLARAQAGLFAQGVSISDLDTCLSGVEKSLNQISLGDESGAAATLSGVASSCKEAAPS